MSNAEELAMDAQQRIARFVNGARETLATYLQAAVDRGFKGAIYYWCEQGDNYVFSIRIQAEPPRFPVENLVGNIEKYDLTGHATAARGHQCDDQTCQWRGYELRYVDSYVARRLAEHPNARIVGDDNSSNRDKESK